MIAIMFLFLTLLLLYIYVGYPAMLCLLARIFPRRHRQDESAEPTVTLIVSARNEDEVIGEKLQNALLLDYPADKLTVMVVSDASSDRTDSIVRSFARRGVILLKTMERRGKTAGLNLAVESVATDLVVFSDANALYEVSAIRKLVRHFADPEVGYVVGHARYDDTADSAAGRSEGAYWDMEIMLKKWESTFSSVVGGDGAIYAIRRHLYEPLQETDINDFVNPLQIIARGYRGIFDPEAICSEKPAGEFAKEFARKVRIANRSFNGLLRVAHVCNPMRSGRFAWQLVSHKVLRWFSPFILCLHLIVSSAAVSQSSVGTAATAVVGLYGSLAALALAGSLQNRTAEAGFRFVPYYFVLMNVALATGILLRLKGRVITVWETVRSGGLRQGVPAVRIHLLILFTIIMSLWSIANVHGLDRMFAIVWAYVILFIVCVCLPNSAWRRGEA